MTDKGMIRILENNNKILQDVLWNLPPSQHPVTTGSCARRMTANDRAIKKLKKK